MPEGPEVKLFVDKINDNYLNKAVKNIEVLSGRYLKKPIENLFVLKGRKLKEISCKGKFIYFNFDDEYFVFNTLGMTGSWSANKNKQSRIEIEFKDTSKLYFSDTRNFGTFQIKSKVELDKKLKSIGFDMLSNPPSIEDFIKVLRKRNHKNICEVLMNQNIISGVGNYLKAESLWYSRINPHAKVENLTDINLDMLYKAIIYTINKSYQSQGATIKSYYTFDGEAGSSSHDFVVYGKFKDYNGDEVIKEETLDKRTTHWSPARQTII